IPGLLKIALLDRRQRAIHHDKPDLLARNEPNDLLDLALAEVGRGPDLADRRDQRVRDRQVDSAGEADGLFQPRLQPSYRATVRLRLGVTAAHPQVRADDDHPPGCSTPCRPRTVSIPFQTLG